MVQQWKLWSSIETNDAIMLCFPLLADIKVKVEKRKYHV